MKEIRFFVAGLASPGGSKSAFCLKKNGVFTGRAVVVDAGGKKTKEWRGEVSAAAMISMKAHDLAPFTGPIEMELLFKMARPKHHFRSNGIALRPGAPSEHVTRPDLLKLARSTEDALTGKCYVDDAQIVKETLEKSFSDRPGCWIVVREVGP